MTCQSSFQNFVMSEIERTKISICLLQQLRGINSLKQKRLIRVLDGVI